MEKKKIETFIQLNFIIICSLEFTCVSREIERRVLISLVTFLIICLTYYFKQVGNRIVTIPNNIVQNPLVVETLFDHTEPITLVG